MADGSTERGKSIDTSDGETNLPFRATIGTFIDHATVKILVGREGISGLPWLKMIPKSNLDLVNECDK
jgi:hypothetical protein